MKDPRIKEFVFMQRKPPKFITNKNQINYKMSNLNVIDKSDYRNRKTKALPTIKKKIEIIISSKIHGDEIFRCNWVPFHADNHPVNYKPGKGYLGTAKIASGKYEGIGFHAWEQNDSEFIYYKVLN